MAERACSALDAFCEALEGDEIKPYLPQLVEKLVQVMQHGTRSLQESALSALASTAAAAGSAFIPHAGGWCRCAARPYRCAMPALPLDVKGASCHVDT